MGTKIEINDTLKLTKEEGLPQNPQEGKVYEFCKSERRLYHLTPVRVFLVEQRGEKWNFIGQAQILELTINAETNRTSGKFVISRLYPRNYALLANKYDAPAGMGWLGKD